MTAIAVRSTTRAKVFAHSLTWLLLAGLVGCHDYSAADQYRYNPVKGKILLPGDKPLTEGGVEFVGVDKVLVAVQGKLEPDGTFSLGSSGATEGVPAGEYRVRIIPGPSTYTKTARGKGQVLDRRKLPFNTKYLDEDTSGLTVSVKDGDNQLEPFRLTK
jgi:hypothetical protein